MSIDRRGFLGQFGAAFAAGAAIAGKRLTAGEVEPPKIEPPQVEVPKVEPPTLWGPEMSDILRLAQPCSPWVSDGQVKSGNFFAHKYLATDCVDLGNRLECESYALTEWRAMRFESYSKGSEPIEVYTGTQCAGYQKILQELYTSDPQRNSSGMAGPVYKFTLGDGSEQELFCGSKSLRRFAQSELRLGRHGPCILSSKIVENKRYGLCWHVPTVEKV